MVFIRNSIVFIRNSIGLGNVFNVQNTLDNPRFLHLKYRGNRGFGICNLHSGHILGFERILKLITHMGMKSSRLGDRSEYIAFTKTSKHLLL